MEKRLPLALFLSFLVFMAWSILNPPPEKPAGGKDARARTDAPVQEGVVEEPARAPAVSPLVAEEEERSVELELGASGRPGHYLARFTNRGARLVELRLGNYYERGDLSAAERDERSNWVQLLAPFRTPKGVVASLELAASHSAEELLRGTRLEDALWRMEEVVEGGRTLGVDFAYDPGSGVVFHKRVRFRPDSYLIEVELGLENRASELGGERLFRFTPAAVVPRSGADSYYVEPHAVAAFGRAGSRPVLKSAQRKDEPGSDVAGALGGGSTFSFGGVHSKYFAFLLHPHPEDPQASVAVKAARYRRLYDAQFAQEEPALREEAWRQLACELDVALFLPPRGQSLSRRFEVYAGPKERKLLAAAWSDHRELIDEDLGFFAGVSKVILWILGLYERLVGNFGWAIILMTFTVRLLLFPINRRSQTAMARYQTKMKRIQPKLEELKKRFEKEPQKLRQEQARIMQEEGAFPPLGGCLPIFLQMPVFIGLFQALRVDFDLRQAPFLLWIRDLSLPDRLLTLGVGPLPLLGDMLHYLNVLPILMIVLWILQQKMMPKPTDENQARMMRMMMWMPVIFGIFLYNYAAGLSLYMITSSSLGIFEMRVIKKLWPVDEREIPRKASGFMARLAELQKEQMRKAQANQSASGGRRPPPGKGGKKDKRAV